MLPDALVVTEELLVAVSVPVPLAEGVVVADSVLVTDPVSLPVAE